MLCNTSDDSAIVLSWRSKILQRKVTSSLAGECYALNSLLGEMIYMKSILVQIFGRRMDNLPCIAFTDCRNLHEAVRSTKLVDDSWIITDVAVIKDALSSGDITELRLCSSERMLANCLTKNGACGSELMEIMENGLYKLGEAV